MTQYVTDHHYRIVYMADDELCIEDINANWWTVECSEAPVPFIRFSIKDFKDDSKDDVKCIVLSRMVSWEKKKQ